MFLPGWISHEDIWRELIDELSTAAPVYHLEPRDKPSAILPNRCGFTMGDHARDLQQVLSSLRLSDGEFFMVGSSTGSNIIIEHLTRGGIAPAALALMLPMRRYVFPAWGFPFMFLPYQLYHVLKPAIRLHLRLCESDRSTDRTMLERNYYSLERLEPKRAQRSARALRLYRFPEDLSRISMPALVVGADRDRMHEPGLAAEMARSLPRGVELEMGVSGRAHTAWMAKKILEFFSGQGLERAGAARLSERNPL